MASENRTTPHTLALGDALQEAPFEFGFFSALRRLECAHRSLPRLGKALRPRDEPVRLAQEPHLAFAPATLSSFHLGSGGDPARLSVYFLGLFGPNGPLPVHLTEYARTRLRIARDPTFARFADVFHHRMLALFYRAWANARPTVSLDRPDSDRFAVYVASLFGIGMPSLRDRDAIPDLAKLHYAGRLVCQTRHAEGLAALLSDFFGLPVVLHEFIGHWLQLPRDSYWCLGESALNGTLGVSATVGSRVWDRQYKFRVSLGPLGLEDYRRMLPGGDSIRRLVAMVRNYLGDELDWDLNLILKRDEVPPLELGEQGQLGWTTWLASRPFARDAADLLLEPLRFGACLAGQALDPAESY
ncbi:MAG: type VI secretion system baseplate subunit TssG [Chromatiaceae bacterium]